jgi:acetate kinase
MILLINPQPPLLHWQIRDKEIVIKGESKLGPNFINIIVNKIGNIRKIIGIGYVLYNGGEKFRSTIQELDSNSEGALESCINLLPEYNKLTFEAFCLWMERMPWVKHLLFCDTGFFADLPEEASLYAVPHELTKKGVRRFGGYGIYHHYSSEMAEEVFKQSCKKIISVYIGKNTNIAAIKDRMPIDSTIGFTPIEGIFSDTGCGDVDPTIVFQLNSTGVSFKDINNILTDKSGFTGLLEKESTLNNVLRNKNEVKESKAIKIFVYNILKYIGAYISLLNGVDLIIFSGNNIVDFKDIIDEICKELNFTGLIADTSKIERNKTSIISDVNSKIKLLCLDINRWEIMNNKFLSMYNNIGVK